MVSPWACRELVSLRCWSVGELNESKRRLSDGNNVDVLHARRAVGIHGERGDSQCFTSPNVTHLDLILLVLISIKQEQGQ